MRSAALVVVLAACGAAPAIPRATAPIVLDGEGDEPDWPARARRGDLLGGDGLPARPASEIRLLRDDRMLYAALYAADEDIRSFDSFAIAAGAVVLRVDAGGAVTPAVASGEAPPATGSMTRGVRAAVDRDGTLDDPRDDDEEWVVELAIPLAAIGGGQVAFRASRCDLTKDAIVRCGTWAADLEP